MTSKIRLEIDDATAAGANSAANNVEKIGDAAKQTEGELNQVAKAADNVSDELSDAGKAAAKLGADGKAGTDKVGLGVINLNQGLELLKKGFEVASAAVNALAANGNPAAQSLLDSFGSLQVKLVEIGDDPRIMNLLQGLADAVDNQVAPAVENVANGFLDFQQTIANSLTAAGEYVGVFEAGVTDSFTTVQQEQAAVRDAQKEINEELRKTALVTGRVGEIEAKIAAEAELRAIAAQESASVLNALLDEEIEKRQELADAGELTGKKLEESDRRVETILRRRADLPKIIADKEKAAAQERIAANKAVADAADESFNGLVKKAAEAEKAAAESAMTALADKVKAEADRLETLIAEAKGLGGGNAVDELRVGLDPRAVREQLVKRAQEEAAQRSQSMGGSQSDQRAASRQAGIQAFRQFNAGQTSQADIVSAQNALIQAAGQQAQAKGELDKSTLDAIIKTTNNQQELAATQQAQAQQLQQVQQALQAIGTTARSVGNTSRAQRGGYGR